MEKGLDRLIRAMVDVPGAELVIAGNDDEGLRADLERLAQDLGLRERTTFFGAVEGAQKWELLRSCDLFAMPSISENFGVAALEAMACGRAIVVTPEVGLAPAIVAAEAGAVALGDPQALGGALSRLLADRGLLERMGQNGARLAAEKFSWNGLARRIEAIYLEAAARK